LSENEELTFEQAFEQLQDIVRKLEEGDLPLNESMALFEKGIELERLCEQQLKEAEMRVRELMYQEGATGDTQPFEAQGY